MSCIDILIREACIHRIDHVLSNATQGENHEMASSFQLPLIISPRDLSQNIPSKESGAPNVNFRKISVRK